MLTLTFAWFIGAPAPLQLLGAPFFPASLLVVMAYGAAVRTLSGLTSRENKQRS